MTPPGGWVVPENFAQVVPGIYRSAFPKPTDYEFLQHLQLKSILTLVQEEYPEMKQFMNENNIQHFHVGMPGNKEPFVNISDEKIQAAVGVLVDVRNHPILVHCNRGKHRTGCVIGCLRRLQNWSLASIFDEYRRFAAPKSRALDQQLIELCSLESDNITHVVSDIINTEPC